MKKEQPHIPLTLDVIESLLTDQEREHVEEAAQTMVDETVRSITTETQLRDLATAWAVQAATYKHAARRLCSMLDFTLTRDHDAFYPIRDAYISAKLASRTIELLGIPEVHEDDELARKPGETPYEYIKRTESIC